jgi:predicted TIM-barrel fold metal-dependent hydrolase
MKIFDFHLHPGYDFHQNNTDPEYFVSLLKKNGICGCAGGFCNLDMYKKPAEEFQWRIPDLNRKTWAFHDAYPDFFVPGVQIHPDFVELSCKELAWHKEKGGVLLGEVVYYMMGFQYTHPGLPEIFSYARDLDMVVNLHPSKNMENNRHIIRQVPGMKVVLAHLDGYGLYEDFIAEMKGNENVYADLSAYGASRPGMLRDAVSRVGSERILYGTDFPGSNTETKQQKYISYVLSEGLSTEDTENILYENARRLLRL